MRTPNLIVGAAAIVVSSASVTASDYEKCYVEDTSKNTSTCFIARMNVTFYCDRAEDGSQVSCKTKTNEPVDCVLRETGLRTPKSVWCDTPFPGPAAKPASKQWIITNAPEPPPKVRPMASDRSAPPKVPLDQPALKAESNKAAAPEEVLDCYALSLYTKSKGHNFIEAAAIVAEAEKTGTCKWRK